ncbi:hypothetical protein SDC9_104972 [bioreactor metagenome]|uniref:Uncharacterized protein n=1 Tax=bioreactor metagenome TaxID=1076179 RepID=A0A645B4R9_9ZZZZ
MASPLSNPSLIASAENTDGSYERPANITFAPFSRALIKGSSPIWATILTASSTSDSVICFAGKRGSMLPSLRFFLINSLFSSDSMTASLNERLFSFAISFTMSRVRATWGWPPLPPAVPMITGIPASMAAGIMISRSLFTEFLSVNDLPTPR